MTNSIRLRPVRAAAGLAAAVACAVALSPAPGQASSTTKTLKFYDKPVALSLTTAGGKVITQQPFPEPKPGDVLDVYSLDFKGDHLHHASRWSMSTHLQCVFGKGEPDCVSHVADGGSLLIFKGNPGTLIGGTGRYQNATGKVISSTEVADNASDVVARITLHG
jgi:hypothetical protein